MIAPMTVENREGHRQRPLRPNTKRIAYAQSYRKVWSNKRGNNTRLFKMVETYHALFLNDCVGIVAQPKYDFISQLVNGAGINLINFLRKFKEI